MKNLLIILTFLTLFSCKKTEIQPVKEEELIQEISIYGKWQLIGGDMFVENMDTHVKVKYSHFDAIKTVSDLRYEGALYSIETLTNNITTWSFYQPITSFASGKFVLNGDTSKHYGFRNWSITEASNSTVNDMQMGGSCLPLIVSINDFDNKICDFRVFENFVVINNENYSYFSVLKFKKIQEW